MLTLIFFLYSVMLGDTREGGELLVGIKSAVR